MPEIALLTCEDFAPDPIEEDLILLAALRQRISDTELIPWQRLNDAKPRTAVIRSCWDYFLQRDAFLDELSQFVNAGGQLLNPFETVEWNSDKSYLLDLNSRGIPIPETVLCSGEELEKHVGAARKRWGEVVVKPTVGAGAHETRRLRSGDTHDGLGTEGAWLVQRYLPEVGEGEWSVVFIDGVHAQSVLKRPATGDFRVQAEHGGSYEVGTAAEDVMATARLALQQAPQPTLYARADIVQAASGPVLMELELIEPELFLRCDHAVAESLAESIVTAIH